MVGRESPEAVGESRHGVEPFEADEARPDARPHLGLDVRPPTLADRIDDLLVVLDELRQRRGLAVGAAVVVAVAIAAALLVRTPSGEPVDDRIPQVNLSVTTASARVEPAEVVVHVVGQVRSPGVYVLADDLRIEDAVAAAGGPTGAADLHALNLAAPLVDGSQIRVPAVGDPPSSDLVTGVGDGAADGVVDLNRAPAAQLEALPGVGPSTAAAIVAHREEHGPFRSLEDLLDVPGIGPAKLAGFGDRAVVR